MTIMMIGFTMSAEASNWGRGYSSHIGWYGLHCDQPNLSTSLFDVPPIITQKSLGVLTSSHQSCSLWPSLPGSSPAQCRIPTTVNHPPLSGCRMNSHCSVRTKKAERLAMIDTGVTFDSETWLSQLDIKDKAMYLEILGSQQHSHQKQCHLR